MYALLLTERMLTIISLKCEKIRIYENVNKYDKIL